MNIYRDSAAIQQAVSTKGDISLQGLIAQRLQDLSDYDGIDLAELIHILVIEPNDTSTDVDAELGFSLSERPWDVVESHPGWYEITAVLSDDGFGWVIYVPKHEKTDAALLEQCASYCKESMP
jgi:hypothetical protein